MAEGLLKHAFPDKSVRSAGISAIVGHPAQPFAVEVMREKFIDISAHRGQRLAAWMVSAADLILTMDTSQKRYIETTYFTSRGKVFRLGGFGKYDIADPYQQDINTFRHTYDLIAQGVDAITDRLVLFN
jgi:protein-tyrosine phosphatase